MVPRLQELPSLYWKPTLRSQPPSQVPRAPSGHGVQRQRARPWRGDTSLLCRVPSSVSYLQTHNESPQVHRLKTALNIYRFSQRLRVRRPGAASWEPLGPGFSGSCGQDAGPGRGHLRAGRGWRVRPKVPPAPCRAHAQAWPVPGGQEASAPHPRGLPTEPRGCPHSTVAGCAQSK